MAAVEPVGGGGEGTSGSHGEGGKVGDRSSQGDEEDCCGSSIYWSLTPLTEHAAATLARRVVDTPTGSHR